VLQLSHLAQHDSLTDLNRILVRDRLQQAVSSRGATPRAAVLFVDRSIGNATIPATTS
jgi:hypothetical protein